jgi:hypothetical protein
MIRTLSLTILIGLLASSSARAEDAARFKFTKGEVLTYSIIQTTKAAETIIDEKTNKPVDQVDSTKHTVIRRWKVADVDAQGVATLEMTIASMRWERKLPTGETDIFDSAAPDDLNKNEMAKVIGPVLAVIRVDRLGKVVEVKEGKFASPQRFAVDLPFKIVLPESGPKPGQMWDRAFSIKLDPPQGTGEKYDALQKFVVKAPVNGLTTIGTSTTIKEMPAQAADQIPLLPMMLEGDVYFHETSGRYYAARLKLKKELLNHAGEGTKYVFESSYQEDLKLEK